MRVEEMEHNSTKQCFAGTQTLWNHLSTEVAQDRRSQPGGPGQRWIMAVRVEDRDRLQDLVNRITSPNELVELPTRAGTFPLRTRAVEDSTPRKNALAGSYA